LSSDDLKKALPGMGSTYCCIGQYQKSIERFQHALTLFPNPPHEFNVFLGMAYYNIGEHAKTMELLLNSLADTSTDEGIRRCQRAIRFYFDKLDQTW
jgi:tetratricopeptide (TPR) repeat protein